MLPVPEVTTAIINRVLSSDAMLEGIMTGTIRPVLFALLQDSRYPDLEMIPLRSFQFGKKCVLHSTGQKCLFPDFKGKLNWYSRSAWSIW